MIQESKDRTKDAHDHLERLRLRLLDLTGRNRFLNFRHSETSKTQLRFVDVSLEQIRQLIESGSEFQARHLKKPAELTLEEAEEPDTEEPIDLGLASKPARKLKRFNPQAVAESARSQGVDPSYDLRLEDMVPNKIRDVQTLLFPDDLQRRLQGIYDEERRYIQELGINTLYFCVGFLEWYEADHSDKARLAPLLLYPMQVQRTLAGTKYQFRFSGIGEEPESNISLIERLARDFGIRLPEYDPESDRPEDYLAMVASSTMQQKRWRVRSFATIAILNFAKLAMYRDLDPAERPPDAQIEEHQVIQEVLAGVDQDTQVSVSEDDVEKHEVMSSVPLLVTEADSSQFAAIVEALSGNSLVIEGPPGTGKSQTITNIIAAALSKGLRVLFVAEKLAALQVVKSKLDSYKLGPFCLELHSTKARKADVHKSIADRIHLERVGVPSVDSLIAQIEQQKKVLGDYTTALHSHFGKLGAPIHDLLWREQRLRLELGEDASGVEHFIIPSAPEFDPAGMSEASQTLEGYESTHDGLEASYGDVLEHPWYGVAAPDADLEERQRFIQWFRGIVQSLEAFGATADSFARDIGAKEDMSIGQWIRLAELCCELADNLPSVPVHVIRTLRDRSAGTVLERFISNIEALEDIQSRYGATLLDKIEPASSELADALNAVTSDRFEEFAIGALITEQNDARSRIDELKALATYVAEVESVLGSCCVDAIAVMGSCAGAIASTSRAVVLARTPSIVAEENSADLGAMVTQGKNLAAKSLQLRSKFDLDDVPAAAELREMGRTLRDAGLLWWIRPEVRVARKIFRRHSLQKQPASNEQIGEAFGSIADFTEELKAFESSERFKRVAGPLFEGIKTDFGLVESIAAFASNIRSITSKGNVWDSKLRDALLMSADVAPIDRIVGMVEDERFQRAHSEDCSLTSISKRMQQAEATLVKLAQLDALVAPLGLPASTTSSLLRKLLGDNQKFRDLMRKIEGDGAAKSILHDVFKNAIARRTEISAAVDYARRINDALIPESVKDRLAECGLGTDKPPISSFASSWALHKELVKGAVEAMEANSLLNCDQFFGASRLDAVEFSRMRQKGSRAVAAAESLEDWIRYARVRTKAMTLSGTDLIEYFEKGRRKLRVALRRVFEYLVIRSVVRAALDRHPALRDFPGVSLSHARQTFQKLDQELIEVYRRKLAGQLYATPVDFGNSTGLRGTWTGKALLNHEIGKQKRHVAIRDLVRRAGNALQQLKPCFMMSPLSVAQYIAPGTIEFDLVVIDEASQMKPEDALGALSRGKRAVVVGDPKQLPPTSFFERVLDDDETPDEDVVESESILDLAISQYGKRRLRWHYRSRHESLIAFSNRHFYDNDLIVFPSPDKAGAEFGVRNHFVGGFYKNSVNPEEARVVAESVIRFMHESPQLSVGVVAMNRQQRDLINEAMDKLIAGEPVAAQYVAKWDKTLYPYFVKNLESVQGDERDVIIISTVYGPEEAGRPVAQRFGPILGQSGWRRLNVLFTRARNRVELFTSMRPSDIRVDELVSSRGVVALKNYLDYAQTGRLETGATSRRPPDSDFEIAVARMLEAKGFEVEAQVGVSHYYIDLAVRNPRNGSYLIGIECDGATYHSAKSARDRDRTREEALNELGWSLYRIWSTDWFADPRREFAKLESALRVAIG